MELDRFFILQHVIHAEYNFQWINTVSVPDMNDVRFQTSNFFSLKVV